MAGMMIGAAMSGGRRGGGGMGMVGEVMRVKLMKQAIGAIMSGTIMLIIGIILMISGAASEFGTPLVIFGLIMTLIAVISIIFGIFKFRIARNMGRGGQMHDDQFVNQPMQQSNGNFTNAGSQQQGGRFCPQCGSGINGSFCGGCGTRV